jgi:hypothetical protein
MATTTPNYGWTVPTSTDLVKDGATAIETLGDAIDASMNTALGTKKAGMVLLNTTSFSAVASQSVNDVFSATYQNYRIVLNISSQNTAGNAITMRLRVSGTDATTNYFTYSYHTRTSLGAIGADNGNPGSVFWVGYANPTYPTAGTTDLFSPFETRRTVGTMQFMGGDASTFLGSQGGVVHDTSASYTGFTILAAAGGTITGNVRVYGYNN